MGTQDKLTPQSRTDERTRAESKSWADSVRSQEGLAEDLAKLARVPVDLLVCVAGKLATDGTVDEEWLASTSVDASIAPADLESATKVLVWLLLHLPEQISLALAIQSLVEAQVIEPDAESPLIECIRRVGTETGLKAKVDDSIVSRRVLDPALPRLKGVWTRCVAVARFEPEYDVAKDDPDSYGPEFRGFVSAVAVQMDLDVFGQMKRISFGLTASELERMIRRLRLAQSQLLSLGRHTSEDNPLESSQRHRKKLP